MALIDISARGGNRVFFEAPKQKISEKTQKTRKNREKSRKITKKTHKTATKRQKTGGKRFRTRKFDFATCRRENNNRKRCRGAKRHTALKGPRR